MDDDDLTMGVDDWYDYCKKMFRKVTKNDLIEFENKYKGKEMMEKDRLIRGRFLFRIRRRKN